MTRKHVREIADILSQARLDVEPIVFSGMVCRFRQLCRSVNERFDGDKFTQACYGKDNESCDGTSN